MELINRFKAWWAEKGPKVEGATENKYVQMVYDRFGSLPPGQQRQLILIVFGLIAVLVFLGFASSFMGLTSVSSQARNSQEMIALLQKYQKEMKAAATGASNSPGNANLVNSGALRSHLEMQGRRSNISARMMKIDESLESQPTAGGEEGSSVKVKRATVTLERINLNQLVSFLQSIEHGNYDLSVSSLKIVNDRQVRGYMNVDLGIVAYIVGSEES